MTTDEQAKIANLNFAECIADVIAAAHQLRIAAHTTDGKCGELLDWARVAADLWKHSRATQEQILAAERDVLKTFNEVVDTRVEDELGRLRRATEVERNAEIARLNEEDDREIEAWRPRPLAEQVLGPAAGVKVKDAANNA